MHAGGQISVRANMGEIFLAWAKKMKKINLDKNKQKLRLVDAVASVLWQSGEPKQRTTLSFPEITDLVSNLLGYKVPQPSIRCIIYIHPELFEKATNDSIYHPRWRITKALEKVLLNEN
jgi:hypothetical protein